MQVVNFRNYGGLTALNLAFGEHWEYVGRRMPAYGLWASKLANPFTARKYGRGEAVTLYRQWLWECIKKEDFGVLNALRELNEASVLVCWCKPKACHGDVIAAAWQWLQDEQPKLLIPSL